MLKRNLSAWSVKSLSSHQSNLTRLEQITNFIEDFVLGSYHILCIASATADLDAKYEMSLGSLALDVEGKLVQTHTLPGTSAVSVGFRP
jgi:hypothetical protein